MLLSLCAPGWEPLVFLASSLGTAGGHDSSMAVVGLQTRTPGVLERGPY